MNSQSVPLTIGSVAGSVWRHKWKASFCFLFVLSAVAVFTLLAQKMYKAEAKIYVSLGRDNVALDPTANLGQGPGMVVPESREAEINSVVSLLTSREILGQVVDLIGPRAILEEIGTSDADALLAAAGSDIQVRVKSVKEAFASSNKEKSNFAWLNPFDNVSARDRAILKVASNLSVGAPRKSHIIDVDYAAPHPELAERVVDTLLDVYLQEHMRINSTPGSLNFFNEQTSDQKLALEQAETKLKEAKNSTGLADIENQRKLLVERIARLQDEIFRNDAELAASLAQVKDITAKLQSVPESVVVAEVSGIGNDAADGMRQRLFELQLREQQLLSTYKEEMFLVQDVRREIEEAKNILKGESEKRTETTLGLNQSHKDLELLLLSQQTEASALRARAERMRDQLVQSHGELELLNEQEVQLARLQREISLKAENYRNYAQNLELARIDQELETRRISNIRIAQAASANSDPVRPRKLLCAVFGFGLATSLSIGLAVACDATRRTIRTTSDLQDSLNLPALGSIPRMRQRDLRRQEIRSLPASETVQA